MKRRIIDNERETNVTQANSAAAGLALSSQIEKCVLPSGLFLYRYHLRSYPPNVQEHDDLNRFLGKLIPKLMAATASRMEPFMCIDGRHLDKEFFARLRESGTTWRPLLGFPVVPGLHPFRFLPIAYHISGREAWNEVAERFLGTGATAIYLTSVPADEFLIRLIQLVFVRDSLGSTGTFPIYIPEAVLNHLSRATGPALKPMLDCFQFFIGENPAALSVDIVSMADIHELISAVAQ